MKKTFIYLTFAICAAAMAYSCAQPLEEGMEPQGGEARIDLSVSCTAPLTRATQAGEETYNENKITHIDWFVFSSNAGTATAIEHGREIFTDKDNVTESFTVKSINMQSHVVSNACSGYVYVIANLPDEYSHDATNGIQHTEGSTTVTDGLTLGALKMLPLTTTFDVVGSNGRFQAQDKFVMASEVVPFRLTAAAKQQTVDADLTRVASKITLELDVVSAIDEAVANMAGRDTLTENYEKTWYPDVENIQIYLSYANSHTTLDKTLFGGTPETYNDANFFTYTRGSFTPTATAQTSGWKLTGTPFYSYPMKWNTQDEHAPFIKIILPWRSYVETPNYETHQFINHEDPNQYHTGNKLVSASRDHANDKTAAAQEFFYKVSLSADDNILESNTWYKISLDVAILGGRSDDLTMEMAGKYYVVDWYGTEKPAGGALVQGSYLKLASDTYYIYGGDSIEIPVQSSHNITTTVTSVSWMDYSTQTPTTRSSNNPSTYSYLTRKPTTEDDGRVKFTFEHELMSDISSASSTNKPDVSEYTFTVRVQNSAGDSKTITIIQQPPLMIINDKNSVVNNTGAVYVNYYTYTTGGWWSTTYEPNGYTYTQNDYGSWIGGVNGIRTSGSNSNPNMYVVSTSVAPSGMMIADPRQSSISYCGETSYGWSSPQGYALGTNTQRALQYYYPADETNAGVNKVAPKFRIASSYGYIVANNGNYLTYREAQKRCASYQEDGIPAGRWRIPTKAEMEFMITLSNIEVIPSLFSPTDYSVRENRVTYAPNYYEGGYWTADGGVIYPWTDGTIGYLNATEFATHSGYNTNNSGYAMTTNGVRCVYDEWFWGTEDRLATNQRTRFTWGDKQIQ